MTGIDVERGDQTLPPPPPGRTPDAALAAPDTRRDSPHASPDGAPHASRDGASSGSGAIEYRLGAEGGQPKLTRRGRISKWDRPPPPRDWRWYVGHLGRVLIAVGILMFGFVAYQLWGTGIENAAAQRSLENDFEELLAEFDPITPPGDTSGAAEAGGSAAGGDGSTGSVAGDAPANGDGEVGAGDVDPLDDGVVVPLDQTAPVIDPVSVVPAADQNLPPVDDGDAIARIEIPRIGVSDIVVAGIDIGDLKRGPGHFPDTPLPGQLGNAAIAGHRTTYGAPFFRVDELDPGDEIRVTTLNGVFVYRVTGQRIVAPSEYQVVATTDPSRATLTLVSCHPRYTAQQRIIISAELDPTASGAVGEPVLNYGRPAEPEPDDSSELPAGADGDVIADGGTSEADVTGDDNGDDNAAGGADSGDDSGTGPDVATPSGSNSTTGSLTVEPATAEELLTVQSDSEIADVFSKGWFSDPGANPHVGAWGAAVAAIALLAYAVSRRLRRDWAGLAVGVLPFAVALYFFFQNVNRLLPPNL